MTNTLALVPSLDAKLLPSHAFRFPYVWEAVGTPPGCMDSPYFVYEGRERTLVVPIYWQGDRFSMSCALARAMLWCREHYNINLVMAIGTVGIGLDLYRTDTVWDIEFDAVGGAAQ